MSGLVSPAPVVAVTGLVAEARLVAMPGVRVVCGPDALAELRRAPPATLQAAGWISVGIAAGLDPALRPGTLLVGRRVVAPDGTVHEADGGWAARLLAALPGALHADLAGVDEVVTDPAAKARIRAAAGTGTLDLKALDMESHHAARLAAATGRPFAVLRAVSDPAGASLPPAVLAGWTGSGGTSLMGVLGSLARHPFQLPGLVRAGLQARAALHALARVRDPIAGRALSDPLSRVGEGQG